MHFQPFILVVGVIQFSGGVYSAWWGDWKMAAINVLLGLCNAIFSTMGKP